MGWNNKRSRENNKDRTQIKKPRTQEEILFDEGKLVFGSNDTPHRNKIAIWNFETGNKGTLIKKDACIIPKNNTSPQFEYKRACLIKLLREEYEKDCSELLYNMSAPKESFNRWLFEQLAVPKSKSDNTLDPVLCLPELSLSSSVIKLELTSEVPARVRHRFPKQAYNSMSSYITNGEKWLHKLNEEFNDDEQGDSLNEIRNKIREAKQWHNSQPRHITEEHLPTYKKKLEDLKETCSPLFHGILQDNIDTVCRRLHLKAVEVIKEMQEQDVDEQDQNTVKVAHNDQVVTVTYGKFLDTFDITMCHYNKLRLLFRKHNQEQSEQLFLDHLYVLLRRYQTFFGPNILEGGNFHAALPEAGFDLLNRHMEVSQECFASPLNCYFSEFCSAFPDIDVYFGSRGSFFDFEPEQGSFECGPPYTVEVMDQAADRCIQLLEKAEGPLSFVVFVPEWTNTHYGAALHPDQTNFCVGHFLADSENHQYVTGLQHLAINTAESTNRRYWTLPFHTHVYFLQNEKGRSKWPVTQEFMDELKRVMCTK
ncbi:hypothetical protein AKO1_006435 [Acrasis kona]|uniref:PCIF1 WW domain-containing protein n=1 Tax=Acrasis kona TaxID=1008807 RepID=A0AAW2YK58_9EUKA